MTVWLPAALALAIGLPHALRLERAEPAAAAAIWLAALALRALAGIYIALFVVFLLPATELFGLLTHWCWHTVLPYLATHLGLDGHAFGDAAAIAPSFVLAASAVSVAFGLARAARAVRAFVRRAAVGAGPQDSVIVGGPEVLVAAAGLRRPRIVVSAGALTALDDDELTASLAHERGHIHRRHRYLLVFAELCRALGRFLPGTGHAMRELGFHLERDADHWALARRSDPAALASAICKAAISRTRGAAALTALGGGGATRRVSQLLESRATSSSTGQRIRLRVLAAAMAGLALGLGGLMPAAATAGVDAAAASAAVGDCPA